MANPTRQHFRRPALYLKLPSEGKYYPPGSLDMPANGEIPIYPMTGIDEITSKTVDALYNGTAVIDIIKSCVPNIKDPWVMPSMDINPVLIAIRMATDGNTMDIENVCPNCDEHGKFGLNLVNILMKLTAGDYDNEREVNGVYVRFKPVTHAEYNEQRLQQFEFRRSSMVINNMEASIKAEKNIQLYKDILKYTMRKVSSEIEYVRTPEGEYVYDKDHILEFIINSSVNDFKNLVKENEVLLDAQEIEPLKMKCTECEHEFEQPFIINVSEYFRTRLLFLSSEEIQKLLDQMEKDCELIKSNALKMSWFMRGGVSYNDVLEMNNTERLALNKIIDENLETTKKTQLPFF